MSEKKIYMPEKSFRAVFSEQITIAIDASGKERQIIAKEAGITAGSITGYCQSDYVPNFYVAYKLAKVLNINLHQLAEGSEPPPPEYAQLEKIFRRMANKVSDNDTPDPTDADIIPEEIRFDQHKLKLLGDGLKGNIDSMISFLVEHFGKSSIPEMVKELTQKLV